MIPLWSGIANTWDCDEMGHMNVRVYSEKAMEGIAMLAGRIAMNRAYKKGTRAILLPREQHIRYMGEVHPGTPLTMMGCVYEWDETGLVVYQEMRHGNGKLAAVFWTRLIHAETESGRPFPWSRQTRLQLDALTGPSGDPIKPRGVDPAIIPVADDQATLRQAISLGAPAIGHGSVPPHHCDIFGRMHLPWFMGRVSDSAPNLLYDWRAGIAANKPARRMGGAVLEWRLICRAWPRAGDRLVIHSGLADNTEKTHSFIHWIVDPDSGQPWATAQILCVVFDLDARKIVPLLPRQIQALEDIAPRGMKL